MLCALTIEIRGQCCQGEQKADVTVEPRTDGIPESQLRARQMPDGFPGGLTAGEVFSGGTISPGSSAGRPVAGGILGSPATSGAGVRHDGLGNDRRRRDRAHAPQNHVLTSSQPRTRAAWIEGARVVDRRSQQRSVLGSQVRSRFSKIRSSSRFRTVDPVPPFDHIQIELEDSLLGELSLESSRDQQLPDFANGVLRRRQVEILRQLLRNRAGAARELHPLEVRLHRFLELLVVDTFVLPERAVFGHDHGAFELRGYSCVRHPPLDTARLLALLARLARPKLDERGGLWDSPCAGRARREASDRCRPRS